MKFQCITTLCIFLLSCSNTQKAEQLYKKAFSHFLEKNFATAKELCLQSLKEAETSETLLLLSKIYFLTNDANFEKTIQHYISHTNSTQGYILYARWLIRNNKPKEAKKFLHKAIAHSPHDPAALYLLGSIHYAQKEYDDAIITFHNALTNYYFLMLIHKQLASIYSEIGLTKRSSNHTAMIKAITDFDKEFQLGE